VSSEPGPGAGAGRSRLDWFELTVLSAFGAMSMWIVAIDLWQVIANGKVWTGTDGFFVTDQMQYLSWIVSASQHLLVNNMFVLRSTPADYFQPAIAISGGFVALGVAPWLSLLLWKPVAVIGLFLAMRAVAYRSFEVRAERRAALALGLLFGSFSSVYGAFSIVGDEMPGWLSWGYPFGLMSVALIALAMLRYDRARTAGRLAWGPGLLGALASSLHPWQGEILILVLVAAEATRWRELALWVRMRQWRRLGLTLATLALTGIPLLYYVLLGRLDISWGMARQASRHAFPFLAIAIGIAPLAVFAALGYRRRARDFFDLTLRMWLPAALVIYLLSATALSATPLHAFNGITVPLAVLAVSGVRQSRLARIPRGRVLASVALLLGCIPANAYALAIAHRYTDPTAGNVNFISRDERAALDYLRHTPDPGGVLTQFYLGEAVPGRTGRQTLVGDCLWSEPRCSKRSKTADALFLGRMTRAQARRFVIDSGARFILSSCRPQHVDLRPVLGSLIVSTRRFGCATVYELGPPGPARGPLEELPDASVRASRRH
jgi:hypothetical protein